MGLTHGCFFMNNIHSVEDLIPYTSECIILISVIVISNRY